MKRKTNYHCRQCNGEIAEYEASTMEMLCTNCYTEIEKKKNEEDFFTPQTITSQMAFISELHKLEQILDIQTIGSPVVSSMDVEHILYTLRILGGILGYKHKLLKQYVKELFNMAEEVNESDVEVIEEFEKQTGFARMFLEPVEKLE